VLGVLVGLVVQSLGQLGRRFEAVQDALELVGAMPRAADADQLEADVQVAQQLL